MSNILVVGSLAYDSIETPFGKVDKALGGSANYFSLAAALTAKVRVVGVVGEDYEESNIDLLKSRSVDLAGMQKQKGKTFHWSGMYEGDMNQAVTRATELNVFENFNPVLPQLYQSTEFVFLANISPDLQLRVLEQVKNPTYVGMDTMNFWITSKLDDLKKVLQKVNVILINEGEAKMLTGAANAIGAAKKMVEHGPEAIVIKRGEYGFILYHRTEGYFILPAFPVADVIDPTGAGDTFAGGFFGALASFNRRPSFEDLKMACIRGTLLASFTIQDFTLNALKQVTESKVQSRLREFNQMLLFGKNIL